MVFWVVRPCNLVLKEQSSSILAMKTIHFVDTAMGTKDPTLNYMYICHLNVNARQSEWSRKIVPWPSSGGWSWGFGMSEEPIWKLWAVKTAVGNIVGESWPWKFGRRGGSNLMLCRPGMAVCTEHQSYIWYLQKFGSYKYTWNGWHRCLGMYFPHSRFSVFNPFVTRGWLIFFDMSHARIQIIHVGLTTVLPHLV